MSDIRNLPPILPVGTAVVVLVEARGADGRPFAPRGSAGVIVSSPADPHHAYRVRFPGGEEVSFSRRDIQPLSHYQSEELAQLDPLTGCDLYQYVIYRCIIGSRAYGLEHDDSDTDRRGVYLPPASIHWSIYGAPEQVERHETQECYWEFGKFITLALKANPNVLEVLYTPLVEYVDPIIERLRSERMIFLSRLIYQTFNGYAMSQFAKIERRLQSERAVKWKHAMHLIRLLRSGIEALRTGDLPVRVTHGRDELLRIRDGRMAWEEVDRLRLSLHEEFHRAFETSSLPDRPDYERANCLLIEARRAMAERERHS